MTNPGRVPDGRQNGTADRIHRICGVDEAGRGPLAGPVVAAAVILDPEHPIPGLRDSKKLSERHRDLLAGRIREQAACWAIGMASVAEIETLNILHATMLAMQRAVAALAIRPTLARVDGNRAPDLTCRVETLVGGDDLDTGISAASILAKTHRDAWMRELDARFPGYGFARHKGYGTREHLQALQRLGPCPEHRAGFAPVRQRLLFEPAP